MDDPAALKNHVANATQTTSIRERKATASLDPQHWRYLRAIVTAERDLRLNDEMGVRNAFMQAFRLRGIVPETSSYFSEGDIAWF